MNQGKFDEALGAENQTNKIKDSYLLGKQLI
jgi:hypothetical protein